MRNLMIKVQDKAVKIKETEAEIADRLDKIPDTLKEDGYPDVQVFMRTSVKWKALWNSTTVILPSWNAKSAGNRQPPLKNRTDRPKSRAY